MIDAESFLNSCPLTYVSSQEVDKPLTPSHQLIGCHIISLLYPVASDDDDDELESTEGLTHGMTLLHEIEKVRKQCLNLDTSLNTGKRRDMQSPCQGGIQEWPCYSKTSATHLPFRGSSEPTDSE